jgi:hypothetical protein
MPASARAASKKPSKKEHSKKHSKKPSKKEASKKKPAQRKRKASSTSNKKAPAKRMNGYILYSKEHYNKSKTAPENAKHNGAAWKKLTEATRCGFAKRAEEHNSTL